VTGCFGSPSHLEVLDRPTPFASLSSHEGRLSDAMTVGGITAGCPAQARSGWSSQGLRHPEDLRGVVALDSADFEAPAGQVAGLIGPNGSGKTTLINVLTGMIAPDAGGASLDGGELVLGAPAAIAARGVGRTFQHIRLLPELSVRENVVVGGIAEDLRRPLGTLRLWLGAFGTRSRPPTARRRGARNRPALTTTSGLRARRRCRMACSGAWRSRARCAAVRSFFCSMSPLPA